MRKTFVNSILIAALLLFPSIHLHKNIQATEMNSDQNPQLSQIMKAYPQNFIENRGQMDDRVKFSLKIPSGNVFFTPSFILFQFVHSENAADLKKDLLERVRSMRDTKVSEENIRVQFIGTSEKNVKIEGWEECREKINYFHGNDPEKWITGARTFKKVIYKNLYPHIDLIVYGDRTHIKHEYRIRDGGNPEDIVLRYEGIEGFKVNRKGQLEVKTQKGVLLEDKPLSYQIIEGENVEVRSSYIIDGDDTVRFSVGKYDRNKELIIDPELIFSTYLGGSAYEEANDIQVDNNGNVYIAGQTHSSNFPTTPGAFDRIFNENSDVFVTKLNSSGSGLIYSTFIGGINNDEAERIAVDTSGCVYVIGRTESFNFPTTPGVLDTNLDGTSDAFVTKVSPTGDSLIYSSFLGGSGVEWGYGIAVDLNGNALVTGGTSSTNFPITPMAYDVSQNGHNDAFVTKINTTCSALIYSTYLGASSGDSGDAIAIDKNGYAYVLGRTSSSDFPTTPGAYRRTRADLYDYFNDIFVAKLNPAGSTLVYSTYYGSYEADYGEEIVVDGFGNAYFTGATEEGPLYAFVAKLNAAGSDLTYNQALIGFSGLEDVGSGIAIDSNGTAYIAGYTGNSDFPTTPDAYDTSFNGGSDVFIATLDSTGSAVLYSTFFGWTDDENAFGLALDQSNIAYITGITNGSFPTTSGAFDISHNGDKDGFVFKFLVPPRLPLFESHDFDGNSTSDLAVWRPEIGRWFIKNVGNFYWGQMGDIPANADYDGNGTTDIAVWRPSNGRWFLRGFGSAIWGQAGDIPVPGDYNGGGWINLAVWRPLNGRWYIQGIGVYAWGQLGDFPVPGDYNGDGITDIAVWRPSSGRWYLKGLGSRAWGIKGDIPVPGDYNGDGTTDIAVWRPSSGKWFIRGVGNYTWGQLGDVPVPGDYNGDGITDLAVWRPLNGRWYLKGIGNSTWGQAGDMPVVR